MAEERRPGRVPDDAASVATGSIATGSIATGSIATGSIATGSVATGRVDVGSGFDTDGDGRPDTVLDDDGVDLVVAIDLDGDRFADRVLRIGPDAVVREVGPEPDAADGLPGAEATDQ